MARICGSAQEARQLQQDIRTAIQRFDTVTDNTNRYLQQLSESCRDESYDQMKDGIRSIHAFLQKYMQSILNVYKELGEYADFLDSMTLFCAGALPGKGQLAAPGGGAGTGKAGTGGRPAKEKTTSQVWHSTDAGMMFDNPVGLGKTLDTCQYKSSLDGSCGLCASENVCCMAGKPITQKGMEDLAMSKGFCDAEGGTNASDRQEILEAMGIKSYLETASVDNIVAAVAEGRGVIVSVDADLLYSEGNDIPAPHAITVTSVICDKQGNVTDLIVCDSNADALNHTGAHRYGKDFFASAILNRLMNVTEVIR